MSRYTCQRCMYLLFFICLSSPFFCWLIILTFKSQTFVRIHFFYFQNPAVDFSFANGMHSYFKNMQLVSYFNNAYAFCLYAVGITDAVHCYYIMMMMH
ncbi:uncharacterized protein LOC142325174 isoform X2 [Lycorma delicatula]|uniref:uncharacterized protein LOC142325174 isoform X2 n=1 Tax=Lycorma delicatula TaxID=130591 RepID=UPI003F517794